MRKIFKGIFFLLASIQLYACAYFDSDGLSKSPDEVSYEDLRGCFYRDWMSLEYKEAQCKEVCFHDSSATIREKFLYLVVDDSGNVAIDVNPDSKDTTYESKVVLREPEIEGSFTYNLSIEDDCVYIYEDCEYGKCLRSEFWAHIYTNEREKSICDD